MKKIDTFTAQIYIGTRQGYSGFLISVDEIKKWLQDFCTEVGLGVTITPTEFIYSNGNEPGVIIGLINYPRFPKSVNEIKDTALTIGNNLLKLCKQERLSIVFSDETIMLEKIDE